MLKELALLVTLLALFADARPQGDEVCDCKRHGGIYDDLQQLLNEMNEEVLTRGPSDDDNDNSDNNSKS